MLDIKREKWLLFIVSLLLFLIKTNLVFLIIFLLFPIIFIKHSYLIYFIIFFVLLFYGFAIANFSKKVKDYQIVKYFVYSSIFLILIFLLEFNLTLIFLYLYYFFGTIGTDFGIDFVIPVIFFTFVWLILRLNGVFTSKYLEKFYNYTNENLFLLTSKLIYYSSYVGAHFIFFILVPISFLKINKNLDVNKLNK
jgi:hypothetical protein